MLHTSQEQKYLNLTPPAAIVDDASLAVTEIDTKGWSRLQFLVILGATDIALTACKLTHGDTSGSGHTDLDGADFDGETDIEGNTDALPSATDDDGIFVFDVDLRHTKRYIDAVITVGDGTSGGFYTVQAILSEPEKVPDTVALHGATGYLRV